MSSFPVLLSFQGKTTVTLPNVTTLTTAQELYPQVLEALKLSDETNQVKILFKGKRILKDGLEPVFLLLHNNNNNNKPPKLMVLATPAVVAQAIASQKSDPTIRGFDQEVSLQTSRNSHQQPQHWGAEHTHQDKNCKFCRFQACTWQSFGHRPSLESTPHDFAARELLDRMATDPGVVAVMKERELVVGTLGEMDPIDDRIMKKKQQQQEGQQSQSCLLGYNTNGGTRIDIKLRTDDLKGFRPYPDLVATLLHELSHNWVGPHNLLFWTNYAQMRAEYLHAHLVASSSMILVKGKTMAELAGLDIAKLEHIYEFIMTELVPEMAQHGLHPNMIAEPIRQRIQELEASSSSSTSGQRLGGGGGENGSGNDSTGGGGGGEGSARERALAAAERRARQEQDREK
jgi:uncharacterized membrane protein YgcG